MRAGSKTESRIAAAVVVGSEGGHCNVFVAVRNSIWAAPCIGVGLSVTKDLIVSQHFKLGVCFQTL